MIPCSYTIPYGRSDYVRIYPDYPTRMESTSDHRTTTQVTPTASVVLVLAIVISIMMLAYMLCAGQSRDVNLAEQLDQCQTDGLYKRPEIPKVIHQIVTPENQASTSSTNNTGVHSTHCVMLYRVHGYVQRFWTLQDVEHIIENNYPDYMNIWQTYKSEEQLYASKYVLLHQFGGVYVDGERCYGSALRMLLTRRHSKQDTLLFTRDHRLEDGVMAARSCSEFMAYSIKLLATSHRESIPPFSNFISTPNRDFFLYSVGEYRSQVSFL